VHQVIADPRRVDPLAQAEDRPLLVLEERDLVAVPAGPLGLRVPVEQFFSEAAGQRGLDDPRHLLRFHLRVERLLWLDAQEGPHLAEPVTPGDLQRDLVRQAVAEKMGPDGPRGGVRPARPTGGPGANRDAHPALVAVRQEHVPHRPQLVE